MRRSNASGAFLRDGLPMTALRVAAFFDMDKTIIDENSGSVYMKSRFERGEIGGWDLAKGLGAYLQYKLGVLDLVTWIQSMAREYEGRSEAELLVEAGWLFEAAIARCIYPEAVQRIEEHRAQGHVVCIVSGSTRFVVEPLAQHLGVEHTVFTQLEVEDGRMTGQVIEPLCFEEGKVFWLRRFIEEQRIELAKSFFYTDSVTDIPLLELVGYPRVVNPDPRLYRAAVRRGWPVRFFESPEK